MQSYDVIIIGGGHNGLTCAAYLGMAGLKVKVLERRAIVGGASVTEEFFPGFRNSIAAYTVSLLNPKIIADLRLFDHGLKIVERRAQNFLPAPDGRYLLAADGQTERNIAKFSSADHRPALDDLDGEAGHAEIGGAGEPIMARPNDDDIIGLHRSRHFLRQSRGTLVTMDPS